MKKYTECHNCENKSDCERTYLGGCTDGEEKKLTERLTEYGKKYPTKELNLLRELEDMLDDGELLSKDYHDEQVFHYVDENAELRAEIEKLKVEFKKELSEHEEFTKKAKAEIERLTEENEYLDGCAKQSLADYQKCEIENAELQKQVEHWKERAESAEESICRQSNPVCNRAWTDYEVKRAVKDTAKEIFKDFENAFSLYYPHGQIPYDVFQEVFEMLAKEKGVEVE